MPYKIVRDAPGCKGGFAVVTEATGKVHGCHPSQRKALAQLRALYANTKEEATR